MSTERDVERIVRSWMDEGVNALPDRVLDLVLDQIPATPQRRAGWPVRRFSTVSTYARFALAAAAVVLAAAIGIALYGNSVGGPPDATATITPSPSSTPVADMLRGQWGTGETTCAQQNAAVAAAGITAEQIATATGGWSCADGTPPESQFVLRFFGCSLLIYLDGALGWQGRYHVVDENTFEAGDTGTYSITYQYEIVGDQLTIDPLSNSCPNCSSEADRIGELIAQAIIFKSAPFTRQP